MVSGKRNSGKRSRAASSAPDSSPGFRIAITGRGKKIDQERECSCCKKPVRPVWRYWTTDETLAYLCQPCVKAVRDRAKKTDAMDYRVPGSFF